jgi:hypothetical protein
MATGGSSPEACMSATISSATRWMPMKAFHAHFGAGRPRADRPRCRRTRRLPSTSGPLSWTLTQGVTGPGSHWESSVKARPAPRCGGRRRDGAGCWLCSAGSNSFAMRHLLHGDSVRVPGPDRGRSRGQKWHGRTHKNEAGPRLRRGPGGSGQCGARGRTLSAPERIQAILSG